MRLFQPLALLLSTVALLSGCATLVSGSHQLVMISSSPAAAAVEVQTEAGLTLYTGSTPATADLPRNGSYKVVITLPGYQKREIYFWRELNLWYLGNLIPPLIPGLIVDPLTGAMWHLGPRQIHVTMVVASRGPGQDEQVTAVVATTDQNGEIHSTQLPMVADAKS